MATIVRIKRSTTTGNPSTLGAGELAYSGLTDGGLANGGDRLYIGLGSETGGDAANHYIIGGKYYTDMMNQTPGTLTASAAVIVDSSKKINEFYISSMTFTGHTIGTTSNANLSLTPNGTGLVQISGAYTLPGLDGTSGYVLTTNGSGTVSWQAVSSSLNIAADVGTTDAVSLLTDTLTFSGGQAITTTVSNNEITIAAKTATSSVLGVASFPTTDFSLTSGAVSLVGSVVKSITTDSGTLTPSSNSFSIVHGTGMAVTHSGTTITITGTDATTSAKGIASFDSGTFTVTSGAVNVKSGGISNSQLANSSITIGSTSVSLGSIATTISGLTDLIVGNIELSSNTISSRDTNGNIILNPNGTGVVDVSSSRIAGLLDPVDSSDAATKNYVDNAVTGLTWKDAVHLLSKTNVPLTGATGLVIDGHTALSSSDNGYRILLTGQTTGSQNGIYVYNDDGTNYTLTRTSDADTYQELVGASVFVEEGTTYGKTGWVQTNHYLTSFSGQQWVQFSGAGLYAAGNGLSLTGNSFAVDLASNSGLTFSSSALTIDSTIAGNGITWTNGVIDVVGTSDRISVSANAIDIASTYVGQTSITTLGTIATGTWSASTIGVAYGGTGLTTITSRGVVYGNGTSAVGVTSASSIDGSFLREDASGNPYWSNVVDGGTY